MKTILFTPEIIGLYIIFLGVCLGVLYLLYKAIRSIITKIINYYYPKPIEEEKPKDIKDLVTTEVPDYMK